MHVRAAAPRDAPSLCRIYNQGIQERSATFETRLRPVEEVLAWIEGRHPLVVVEDPGGVVGFARCYPYRDRDCYHGVADFSVYVDRDFRGRGAGRAAVEGLLQAARGAGLHKLVSRVFVENHASRSLLKRLAFREVGLYRQHAQLDGIWRDVVIVEKILGPGGLVLRSGRDEDGPALCALVSACYAGYAGCVLDVERDAPELKAAATYYGEHQGRLWVAELDDLVVGAVACRPAGEALGLHLLYVHPMARRQGLGRRLVGLVEGEARRRGLPRVELWSDTRFLEAHQLYQKLGYRKGERTRRLQDRDSSVEYGFCKELA